LLTGADSRCDEGRRYAHHYKNLNIGFFGGRTRARTWDPLIKSPISIQQYQLVSGKLRDLGPLIIALPANWIQSPSGGAPNHLQC
jgi:hypothetical protein